MRLWLFASDLHGRVERYLGLLAVVEQERPQAVLLGGDLLAMPGAGEHDDFLLDWLAPRLEAARGRLLAAYPQLVVILGNDDPRAMEPSLVEIERRGLVESAHGRRLEVCGVPVYGYACIPPSPFRLKDWERYDVSRFVDPGCVSPEEGVRSVAVPEGEAKWTTIAGELDELTEEQDVGDAVFLFHSPPYRTALDRAALDGRTVSGVPLDVHVGSIAIRRFIERRQPLLTLHGHVHESARLTGSWRQQIGRTVCLSAAHDGPELALVSFDPEQPQHASRRLL